MEFWEVGKNESDICLDSFTHSVFDLPGTSSVQVMLVAKELLGMFADFELWLVLFPGQSDRR
jgi:hypothetical protein